MQERVNDWYLAEDRCYCKYNYQKYDKMTYNL